MGRAEARPQNGQDGPPPTALVATYGETTVLATVVSVKEPKLGQDFFPLTVNYHTPPAAFPSSFFKREGVQRGDADLTAEIDRPIRPLFAEGYKNETQVVVARCSP